MPFLINDCLTVKLYFKLIYLLITKNNELNVSVCVCVCVCVCSGLFGGGCVGAWECVDLFAACENTNLFARSEIIKVGILI